MATIEPYETAAGKRYRVRYRKPDGKQTDKRGFKRKVDAERFANTIEVDKLTGSYIPPTAGRVTIGELGPNWLKRQSAHMKPSSVHSIESAWKVHVEPVWGRTRINAIKHSEVQSWIAELSSRRSPSLVRDAHSVLARILDDAVRDRQLASNPAREVKLPPKRRAPNKYLTAKQMVMLAQESGRYGSLVLLLSLVGLRWGEAAGIRVADIDFLRRTATLHENAVRVGGETHVGSLKSHKHRTVPLPKTVATELARSCEGKGREDLLWPSSKGKHLGPPSSHDSWLSGAVGRCRKVDETFPRVTAHDLRHTAASLAVASGANVKAIQKMLGHASAAMTLDVYADLFNDDLEAVARKLEKVVGKMWAESKARPA
ncbi:tyrosine-type recombinase/integrase [Nocardia sp. NPDC049190]|uniref:tyrosine-type recombinase/integrase n=1 Tax=Nocardia sp. NPDC049190 TaxID=3155650 RepID=UPI0033ECFFB1